jgi:hypothetical protein
VLTTRAKEGLRRSASITRGLAVFTIVPEGRQSLLAAIVGPLEAMPNLAARAVLAPAPLPASALAERNGVFRRAEAPASAPEAVFTAVAAAAAESLQL